MDTRIVLQSVSILSFIKLVLVVAQTRKIDSLFHDDNSKCKANSDVCFETVRRSKFSMFSIFVDIHRIPMAVLIE